MFSKQVKRALFSSDKGASPAAPTWAAGPAPRTALRCGHSARLGHPAPAPPPAIRSQRLLGVPGHAASLCHIASGQGHAATMSELEKAMIAIIDSFHQYSGKEGDKHKLKKSELKELINNELSHFLGEIKDQETVDKVMEALDCDGDAECDFQEFVAFIAMVTAACHEFFEHE